MTDLNPIVPEPLPLESKPRVPWTVKDTWIGFVLFFVMFIGLGLSNTFFKNTWMMSVWLLVYQPLQFMPILILLLVRQASWADLGFKKAVPNVLAMGCGLLILAFIVNFVNNLVMLLLKVPIQADKFLGLMGDLNNPAILLITGIFIAPLFEETIFRGFLFPGLRQKLGWKQAALISSALFAFCHLQIAAFIPTFVIGLAFSYLYQRSASLWPGIILHMLVNSFSLCVLLTLMQSGIPITF